MKNKPLFFSYFDSPVGQLLLAGDATSLHFLSFPGGHKAFGPQPEWRQSDSRFDAAKNQLSAYFSGSLKVFDLPLSLQGTDFQKQVWRLLAEIPYGATRSYGGLAEKLARPRASRAVGAANGANPIPIIIPCHRVVGATGKLTGFGGGIDTKRFLLDLERPRKIQHRGVETAGGYGQGDQLKSKFS